MKDKLKYLIFFLIFLNILGFFLRKIFVINISSSIPIGIYKIEKIQEYKINDIVNFSTENYLQIKEYKGSIKNINFCKYIVALEKDKISLLENYLYINDVRKGLIKEKDGLNNKLPQLDKTEFHIKEDEVFLLGDNDYSFDSRYYGPIKKKDILYKLVPVIIFKELYEKEKKKEN